MLSKYRHQSLGLLVLRLGLAYEFLLHSWQKIMAPAMTIKFFGRLGLPMPTEFMWAICVIELFGGLCMLLGIFTDFVGLLLAADMLGVIVTVRMGPMAHGWLAGHDFEFMLLLMSLAVALIGPGKWALENWKKPRA